MAKVNFEELNKGLKPINKNTVKSIEKNSARFIYVSRENRIGKCERCGGEFTLATAKHNSTATCPCCHKTMKVIHSWRKSHNESIHWEVVTKTINEDIVVLRYYLVIREDGKVIESDERARYFVDLTNLKEAKYENSIWEEGWKKSGRNFFREYGMSYARNRLCCLEATVRNGFFEEISKAKVFSHFDAKAIMEGKFYATCIGWLAKRADLYEKLQKIGLNDLIVKDLQTYSDYEMIKYDKKQTELSKMLGINKNALNMLKEHATLNALRLLQREPNISPKDFEMLYKYSEYEINAHKKLAEKLGLSLGKTIRYQTEQGFTNWEYDCYLRLLAKLDYDLKDKSYTVPKDFHKEYDRLVAEDKKKNAEFEAKRDELIKAIKDKLQSMPELKEFFSGKNGYMVSCPSSREDFINEGKAQHNCVGGYADRFAKGETLVFFIRECNNPSASFVTMEYCNGAIVQCMYDKNERVDHESKVYNFAEAFTSRLRDKQILTA